MHPAIGGGIFPQAAYPFGPDGAAAECQPYDPRSTYTSVPYVSSAYAS